MLESSFNLCESQFFFFLNPYRIFFFIIKCLEKRLQNNLQRGLVSWLTVHLKELKYREFLVSSAETSGTQKITR